MPRPRTPNTAAGWACASPPLGLGDIHLLNGLYDAKGDGAPVLAITGHTFRDLINTHYQQDVDLDRLFMDVSVYSERVMGPAHLTPVLDLAIKTALSHRGVAHIQIPKDIQSWTQDDEQRSGADVARHSAALYKPTSAMPTDEQLQAAADVINDGSKVAIMAGAGALGARDELIHLADTVGGPIIKPLLGKATVPDDSPYTTGGIGLLGTSPSQDALKECDTLVIVGSSFPYMEFYPDPGQARGVQIDINPVRIGLRYPVEAGLVGDSRMVLQALLPLLDKKSDRGFLETAQTRMQDWCDLLKERGTRDDMPMKPQVVTYHLNSLLDDDAIVSSDSGTIATWSARYIDIRGDMKFSLSGSLATMANGCPMPSAHRPRSPVARSSRSSAMAASRC